MAKTGKVCKRAGHVQHQKEGGRGQAWCRDVCRWGTDPGPRLTLPLATQPGPLGSWNLVSHLYRCREERAWVEHLV